MNSTGDGTPFVIQAPPGLVPADGPGGAPGGPAADGGAQFISLPPGLALPPEVADSATHQLAVARQASTREAVVFLPAPIGMPADAPAAVPDEIPVDSPVETATPLVSARWLLDLGPGVDVIVADAVFVGRNPAASADRPGARLVPVSDPAKSVSKTHALFEVHDDTLYLHDLDSTNGTRVTPVGAAGIRVEPGRRIAVLPGSTVELGDFPIAVTRVETARGT